jgi:hypothetical protein
MASERVADMTIQELKTLVNSAVDERLRIWTVPRGNRSIADVWKSMLENIIEPTPDEPSALDILREEREQWYSHT